jgi:glycosyltransferase involved in cell wall biosynthesis
LTSSGSLKVSYCTTCKGRLHHLKETLPQNLAAEKDNPNVEFVILDYDSPDGLGQWLKENYSDEIASGRIKYARYESAPNFKMAHAKNMAHRLASGDILCNLDADNVIVPDYSRWLGDRFMENRDRVVSHHPVTLKDELDLKLVSRLKGRDRPQSGYGGRIAVAASNYHKLNGYDENYSGWGPDDANFTIRASRKNLEVIKQPREMWGEIIAHGHDERIENLSAEDQQKSAKLLSRGKHLNFAEGIKRVLVAPEMDVNTNGNFGCGNVYINFSDTPTTIMPHGTAEKVIRARGSSDRPSIPPLKNNWSRGIASQKEQAKQAIFERL